MMKFLPALFLFSLAARAEVTVPALFSNHAVLQKAEKVPVWGKAVPGENVTVSIAGVRARATADANGAWRANLDLSAQGVGPFELTIEGASGSKKVITDVLIGEVWVASGQSNMMWELKNAIGGAEEIAAPANTQLRQFLVGKKVGSSPLEEVAGSWMVAGPNASPIFSAIGYYVGKKLQGELKVPVGLINNSWGGSPIQAWISRDAYDASTPDLKRRADRSRSDYEGFPARQKEYEQALRAWETRYDRALPMPNDVSSYTSATTPTTDWKPVTLPGSFAAAGLPDAGAVWFRRTVTLPADTTAFRAALDLAGINGYVAIYWNGNKIAETKPEQGSMVKGHAPYFLPSSVTLQPGEGVLAIRIAMATGGMEVSGPIKWGPISLDGEWLARVEKALPPLDAAAKAAYPKPLLPPQMPVNVASNVYNGVLAPIVPYAIRGVLWYQGESNVWFAEQYRTLFPMMIKDWRAHWGQGDFPFYFCQLPNYHAPKPVPGNSDQADLREAQAMALALPNTGMAVFIDLGEAGSVHPRDKRVAGGRLADVVLANSYGKKIPFAGPTFASAEIEGDAVRIHFTNTDGGLVARPIPSEYVPDSLQPDKKVPLVRNVPNSQIEGFALCGEDRVWKWAEARIDGETVVVRAGGVAKPVFIRYAWADYPICNLYNGAGFPAAPFRTDNFPSGTTGKGFQ
ncbi:MAG: sialate O-acetylesterase [Terrimicrobiaceae bacterium]